MAAAATATIKFMFLHCVQCRLQFVMFLHCVQYRCCCCWQWWWCRCWCWLLLLLFCCCCCWARKLLLLLAAGCYLLPAGCLLLACLLADGSWLLTTTVKGQSRSDSLLLSPYHWAKLFRGVVAIVAVPMRVAVICWIVLEAFVGQIHVFPLCSWMTIQVPGLSRISFWKSYREAVRLEKVQVSHHHNF